MKIKLCLITILFLLGSLFSAWADDTIYCPKNKKVLENECKKVNADIKKYEAHIAKVERYVNDPNYFFISVDRKQNENINVYKNRVSNLKNVTTQRGTSINVPSRYYDTQSRIYYIVMTKYEIHQYLGDAYGYKSSKTKRLYRKAQSNTKFIKKNRFKGNNGKLTKWKEKTAKPVSFSCAMLRLQVDDRWSASRRFDFRRQTHNPTAARDR